MSHTPWQARTARDGSIWIADDTGCQAVAQQVNPLDAPLLVAAPDLRNAAVGVLRMLDAYGYGGVPAQEVEALRSAATKAGAVT